jgi:PIN domain nuclease of toxin-antitoxin system
MILLDTHAFLWVALAHQKLGRGARKRIDRANARGELAVSAISYWEIAMLADAGRVRLASEVSALREAARSSGFVELAIDGDIAIVAARLQGLHGDPADRLIVATALCRKATLLTADQKILTMKGGPSFVDAQV